MTSERLYTLEYCINNADGWVIRNLKQYGNSIFPSELITEEDTVELWEKMLSCIMKEKIVINRVKGGYICQI